ncbi:hypothetical protein [Planktothrix agardhii]|nr:hypothetical protein [Planktothrix agardhii]CAD0232007.1 hypothetical protein PL10110_650026 [Planktothrix agardhii]CAD5968426.1 hypothetical protein NO758_03603 [Planktothrix agardhii]
MKASETKLQKILEGTQQYLVPLFHVSIAGNVNNGKIYGTI